MKQRNNRFTSNANRVEKLMNNYFLRKQESIRKSMIRPLYQELLKSIFLIIVIIIDTLIPLEIYRILPNIVNIILAFITLSIFLFLELYIYKLLWGKNGRWSLEKYKEDSDKNT